MNRNVRTLPIPRALALIPVAALLACLMTMVAAAGDAESAAPHDLALSGCAVEGPPPVSLSDTGGAHMLVHCDVTNSGDHDDMVAITAPADLVDVTLPAGCESSATLVVPGGTTFILFAGETKYVLYKVRFECHAPAIQSIVPLTVRVAVDHIAQPGDENPANNSVTITDNLIIGPPGDTDGDGFTNAAEANIGTRTDKPCGSNGWPANLSDGGQSFNKLDLLDVASFAAPVRRLGTSPGDADYDARWDIVPGTHAGPAINALDITALLPSSQTSTAYPPMFNGAPAFGQTCPFSP